MSLIIANIITTLGAFALVYFAAIKDKRKIKLKSINKQLKEFYIPFYIMYNKNFIIPIINFSAISPEIQLKFMKLFLCKIYLMEPLSQSLVNEFYLNYLEFENYKANGFDSKTKFIDYQNELDMKFIEVSKVILREYKKLLKNISLPIPQNISIISYLPLVAKIIAIITNTICKTIKSHIFPSFFLSEGWGDSSLVALRNFFYKKNKG